MCGYLKFIILMKFSLFVFAFIFFSVASSNAQYIYGCVSDDTGLIYPDLISGTTYDITNPTQPNQGNFCSPRRVGTCKMRVSFKCSECTGPDKKGWYYQAGTLTRYVECPIDDYIPFMLISIAGVAVLFIRNKGINFSS